MIHRPSASSRGKVVLWAVEFFEPAARKRFELRIKTGNAITVRWEEKKPGS